MTTLINTCILAFCFFVSTSFSYNYTNVEQGQADIMTLLVKCESDDSKAVFTAINQLKQFELSSFDNDAREKLASLLTSETKHLDKIIKLAGYVGLKQEVRAFAGSKKHSKSIKKALNLAMVRMGDAKKTETLLRNLRKMTIDDQFVYELLPTIIYCKQKMIYDFLLEDIERDSRKCNPADAETAGNIPCAYAIIEALAINIIDFPASVDNYGIISEDYAKTLSDVRSWILMNKETYKIDRERY